MGSRTAYVRSGGNALRSRGRSAWALKSEVPKEEIERFTREATAGDYYDLLRTVQKWVEVY